MTKLYDHWILFLTLTFIWGKSFKDARLIMKSLEVKNERKS